jgi:hypothetical protein
VCYFCKRHNPAGFLILYLACFRIDILLTSRADCVYTLIHFTCPSQADRTVEAEGICSQYADREPQFRIAAQQEGAQGRPFRLFVLSFEGLRCFSLAKGFPIQKSARGRLLRSSIALLQSFGRTLHPSLCQERNDVVVSHTMTFCQWIGRFHYVRRIVR